MSARDTFSANEGERQDVEISHMGAKCHMEQIMEIVLSDCGIAGIVPLLFLLAKSLIIVAL